MKNKNIVIMLLIAAGSSIGGFIIGRVSKKTPTKKGALVVNDIRDDSELYLKFYTSIQDLCSSKYVVLEVVHQKNTDA